MIKKKGGCDWKLGEKGRGDSGDVVGPAFWCGTVGPPDARLDSVRRAGRGALGRERCYSTDMWVSMLYQAGLSVAWVRSTVSCISEYPFSYLRRVAFDFVGMMTLFPQA
jgi:hypothetical protein